MNNIERINQINNLLRAYYYKASVSKGRNRISEEQIRYSITRFNIPDNERKININEYFSRWVQRYNNRNNLLAYEYPMSSYFCQIQSNRPGTYSTIKDGSNPIKLYISIDSKNIYEGVNTLFDFIDKNNILNVSKVGSEIRSDSIVIRVSNKKDAKKIMSFVKHDKFFKNTVNKNTNPFIPNENGVGYVLDGSLSYNTMVAYLVSSFIDYWVNNNMNREPNVNDLYGYVSGLEKNIFRSGRDARKLISSVDAIFGRRDYTENDVYSLKIAFNLFLKNLSSDFTLADYFKFHDETTNKEKYYYDNYVDVELLLKDGMKIMSQRFDEHQAVLNIEQYVATGNPLYITSNNNLRKKYKDVNFDKRLREFLNINRISCRDLCYSLSKNKEKNCYSEINEMLKNNTSDNIGYGNGIRL